MCGIGYLLCPGESWIPWYRFTISEWFKTDFLRKCNFFCRGIRTAKTGACNQVPLGILVGRMLPINVSPLRASWLPYQSPLGRNRKIRSTAHLDGLLDLQIRSTDLQLLGGMWETPDRLIYVRKNVLFNCNLISFVSLEV